PPPRRSGSSPPSTRRPHGGAPELAPRPGSGQPGLPHERPHENRGGCCSRVTPASIEWSGPPFGPSPFFAYRRSCVQDPNDARVEPPVVERERVGGSDPAARVSRDTDPARRAPIDSTELRRGPDELSDNRGPRVNWRVFIVASLIILAFSVWAMVTPVSAQSTMKTTVDWIAQNLGWFYVVTVTVAIGFVLWVALSKEGGVRLGPDHSRPQYNLFTWVAMLFAAGVGIDMLFYSVTGPITQYLHPVNAAPESAAATQDAVVWTMFHYGIAGWSMYSL